MARSPRVPPPGYVLLTSEYNTEIYVYKYEISACGEAIPGMNGNAWVTFRGTFDRWPVLETVDDIIAMLQ